jgi:Cys-rich repeat protein
MNMKKLGLVFSGLTLVLVACNTTGTGSGSAADAVVLDVRCSANADCPTGFECENEIEQGVSTSFCVSHDEDAAQAGECPAGFELEAEHGGTFCKAHGSDDASGSGGDDSVSSTSSGADDSSTSSGAADSSSSSGAGPGGVSCTSNADCASGLECEIQPGSASGVCKPQGGA